MKLLFSLFICSTLSLSAVAQSKLSAYSLNYLQSYKNQAAENTVGISDRQNYKAIRTVDVNGRATVLAFVTVGTSLPDFDRYQAEVVSEFNDILIVRIPVDNILPLSNDAGVKKISIERPLKVKNNLTRELSLVDKVHATLDHAGNAIKGKDVVVGVIDCGIDYNHIAFKDADGNSRVKRVINGTKKISSASQIASLTTDYTSEDHGTHVASTAAGSYMGNDYYGMAPEADLVLCGLTNFSDAALIDACKYIIDYAKSEGKPCAINMSLGHNSGPHDGSDEFNQLLEDLAEEGVIFSIASGNEGDMQLYLNKQFSAEEGNDSIKTVLANYYNSDGGYYEENSFEIWNFNGQVPEIEFYVINKQTNKVLLTSERISMNEGETSKNWMMSYSDNYGAFKGYYSSNYYGSPEISVSMVKDGIYGAVNIIVNGSPKISSRYYIAMGIFAPDGTEIHAWGADSYSEFRQNGSTEFTAGNASKSFNPMCVGDNFISVGAYNSRNSYKSLNGQNFSFTTYKVGDITDFSSYGEGFNGDSYPDVCAPGLAIFSAYNTYHKTYLTDKSEYVDMQTVNGKNYYWGQMSGTSMATPAVTGMVALWLQYKPTLTGAEAREIIWQTAKTDDFVTSATNCAWGAGKFDAYAGLQKLIELGVNDISVKQDQVLVYPNPNGGQFKVFTQGEYKGSTLNVFDMSGARVCTMPLNAANEAVDVDLQGRLLPGIYVVQIEGSKCNYSTRMIIR